MIVRAIAVALTSLAGLSTAIVVDATSSVEAANHLAQTALETPSSQGALTILDNARLMLTDAWSEPLRWHSGALETKSWIEALIAEERHEDRNSLAASARAAEQAIALSPVQPQAWLRLALLQRAGAATRFCRPAQCLLRSWSAQPMADQAMACARLKAAHFYGVAFSPHDERLDWFAAARPPPPRIGDCLAGYSSEQVFFALMQRQKWQARAAQ